MKRILLLLLIAFALGAKAQVYNNEWIDYSRTYYKFKVGATGLYRITQPTLATIGLGAISAQHFQLWRNGQEVPVYTTVQAGPMSGSDYIEFWGEMNDGKSDHVLYRLPDYQLNDKWSLLTDTAAFFLTVNTTGPNLRLEPATNNVAGNILPPDPYFMHTEGKYFKDRINSGRSELVGDSYTYSSSFEYGESWTSQDLGTGATILTYIGNTFPYTGSGAPEAVIKVNAAGNAVHPRYFTAKINTDSVLGQTINYYDYAKASAPINISLLSSGPVYVYITNKCTEPNDRMVVAQFELVYPRQFNFGGASNFNFELPANTAGNYLEISNFSYSGPAPVLYDLTNGKRYDVDVSNPSVLKIALLPSSVDRKLVLVSEAAVNISGITSFQQRNFVNYGLAANQADYIIITHPSMTIGANGTNPVDEYKSYRSSVAGGSHNAKIYMIGELIDQFGLGIKMHPLSIRNFLRWARDTYASPLKDVLLIGKGVAYNQFRVYESDPNMDKLAFVPTYGYPASDNMLSAVQGSSMPLTPIGRISTINADEVALYLHKVKQYEQLYNSSSPVIEDKAWMKNVVHLVGASDAQTSDIILNALNDHKKIIEDTSYAATVTTFVKSGADAVQQLNSSRLTNLFNEGIGVLTYFGHSSSNTLEFNLDNPMNYNNPGKYPVFNIMGCNAGNFFNFNLARLSTKETLSEKFVLAPERGSIAFLASTHLGIVHYLDIYNTEYYRSTSISNYGKTLGEIIKTAIANVFAITTENDFYARFQCEQYTLHGDPALKLYTSPKPDYAIEDQLVKVNPSFISLLDRQFELKAKFVNLGKSVSKKIVVEVKRTYPNTTTAEILKRDTISFTRFTDSLHMIIPIVGSRDKGLNKITVTIDADNEVDELYETNNSVTKDIYIYDDEARPVYPYNYSIVNQQPVKFVVSTANPFAALQQYNMEIDTTEFFNSPAKVTQSLNSPGGVLEFSPAITFTDNTVYYWRVSPAVTGGEPIWNKSSFVYLSGNEQGFNQSHFFQNTKSESFKNHMDSASRNWKFDTTFNNLFIKNGCWVTAVTQEQGVTISLNEQSIGHNTCWFSSLVFNVFDPATLQPWINTTITNAGNDGMGLARFGSARNNCGSGRQINFEWRYETPARRKLMMDFMRDSIPDGYYVVVRNFTLNPATFPTFPQAWANDWKQDETLPGNGPGQSLYHYLKNAGLTTIDSFYTARPFMLVYKKNDLSYTPSSLMGVGIYDNPSLSVIVNGKDTSGYIVSPVFGPAKQWKEFRWEGHSLETPSTDIVVAKIIGIGVAGNIDTLFTGITPAQAVTDISSINPLDYPYLKMYMQSRDKPGLTPYQIDYWRLYYEPVPEGAIAPNIYFSTKDTVEVGEPFNFGIGFKNVSKANFDSVKVRLTITDKNNIEHTTIQRLKNLTTTTPNDTIRLNVPIDTKAFPGHNILFVNFNPDFDQPEQYLFNNFAFRNLYVRPDSLHPLLDVTFDGIHILNRDIVSSKPDILVKLKDEAKWMILDDTSLLTLHVKYPDGTMRRFSFDNDTLKFTPAGQAPNPDNTATINFKPYFLQDGDYEMIVTGKDRSENSAGNIEYRVGFQVINKPMISNMLNYPNPFTTSTAFVFTITGSEVPQNIRIQILTITGKIVRDITKDELGPLHIGRNITEFKWDGTDQYGQKLANGIYLYRVITNLHGKSLDKYKAEGDNTDKYFNKGYGKMYLMR